jgi:hypothetical protein
VWVCDQDDEREVGSAIGFDAEERGTGLARADLRDGSVVMSIEYEAEDVEEEGWGMISTMVVVSLVLIDEN